MIGWLAAAIVAMTPISSGTIAVSGTFALATENWQPISTAPRDGTVIEIQCRAGILPYGGLFRYSKEPGMHWVRIDGAKPTDVEGPTVGPGESISTSMQTGFGEDAEPALWWRPYTGAIENYVSRNPTMLQWCVAAGGHERRCLRQLGKDAYIRN